MERKNQKTIYIEDSLWKKAIEKCKEPEIDRSLSQVVRGLLEMWLDGKAKPYPEKF